MFKKIIAFIIAIAMVCAIFVACGPASDPAVEKIEILTLPAKTQYYVGETFSAEGGKIKVTYDDNNSEVIDMTADGVALSAVDTQVDDDEDPIAENQWKRAVTVRFGGKSARFDVFVSHEQFAVTFDLGYGNNKDIVTVNKGSAVAKPGNPERADYEFDGWYTDPSRTLPYDFLSAVTENMTIYAKWMETAATYYSFIFDYNYFGVSPETVTQQVEENSCAVRLSVDPTRDKYRFDGWYTNSAGTTEYNFASAVTANTRVYAKWTRTVTGVDTYVFEAENTDLRGKSTPAFSGTYSEGGMVATRPGVGASGDRFVIGMYKFGNSLEFYIACDEAVGDATLVLRLSAEMRNMVLTSDIFLIEVNGEPLDYGQITLTGVPPMTADGGECLPFADFTVAVNLPLLKGSNTILLGTMNNTPLEGTTITAIGPLVDCIKITTGAVLMWNRRAGLPMTW